MADLGICTADECGKPARHNPRRLCSMHEARLRRGGTLERRVERMTLEQILGGEFVYGLWTVIGEAEPYNRPTADGGRHPDGVIRQALCRCACGAERAVAFHTLKQGQSRHCGCEVSAIVTAMKTTHGMSDAPEHRSWAHMKERCYSPTCDDYPAYGGRGITVCDRWRDSFEAFYADMGPRPAGTSIDRIDNDGNYEQGNCRWADKWTQAGNKRPRKGLPRNQTSAA